MLPYKVIEIFTSEDTRWHGTPIQQAIVQYVRDQKIAARCQVIRGADGCYESGEMATQRLEILSYNMPLHILIVAPAAECDQLLPNIMDMVTDGIVSTRMMDVICHKTKTLLMPSHIRVRDIMTPSPQKVLKTTSACEVVRVLLSSIFPAYRWWMPTAVRWASSPREI